MEEAVTSVPYVTPTYQSNLMLALGDVIRALNADRIYEGWNCLRTLYYLSPPAVMAEVTPTYDILCRQMNRILRVKGVDVYQSIKLHRKELIKFLRSANYEFLLTLKNSLHKHHYLEKAGLTGINPNPKHIGLESEQNEQY